MMEDKVERTIMGQKKVCGGYAPDILNCMVCPKCGGELVESRVVFRGVGSDCPGVIVRCPVCDCHGGHVV